MFLVLSVPASSFQNQSDALDACADGDVKTEGTQELRDARQRGSIDWFGTGSSGHA